MEGYLLKRGQMGTTKRRYFVLEGPVLAYYAGPAPEERGVPRGRLVLGPDSRVVEVTGRRGACVRACVRGRVCEQREGVRGPRTCGTALLWLAWCTHQTCVWA
jgi:hypothetical protein